jgi:hypothetical protein
MSRGRRPLGGIFAPVRKKHSALPVQQKITPGLGVVIFAEVLNLSTLPPQCEIQSQRGWRKYPEPRKTPEIKMPVGTSCRISQNNEWPPVMLLITA